MSSPKTPVKVVFTHESGEVETRRLVLNQISVAALKKSIRESFALDGFELTYVDDEGDVISVSSDLELVTALSLSQEIGKSLKLYVANAKTAAVEPPRSTVTTPRSTVTITDVPDSAAESEDEEKRAEDEALSQPSSSPTPAAPSQPDISVLAALAISILSDAKVQAELPKLIMMVLDPATLADDDTPMDVVGKLLSSSTVLQANVELQTLLEIMTPHLESDCAATALEHIKGARQQLAMARQFAPILLLQLPSFMPRLLDLLTAILDNEEAGGAKKCPAELFRTGLGPMAHMMGPMIGPAMTFFNKHQDAASKDDEAATREDVEMPAPNDACANLDAHPGISCDGCGQSPIEGVRFKCTRCHDFDLCEKCESADNHPGDHPLLKIRPRSRHAEGYPSEQDAVHRGVQCDQCKVYPIVGARFKCQVCPNYDLCSACESTNQHPHTHSFLKMRVPRRQQQRHSRSSMSLSRTCPFLATPQLKRFAKGCKKTKQHAKKLAKQAKKQAKKKQSMVEFVRDVTIPDGSPVSQGVTLVKTWAVRNNSGVAWPANAKLIFVRGDRELSEQEEFPVGSAQPGETVMISAVLVTPKKPGKYSAYFQLADEKRDTFGHRMWVELVVTEEAVAEGKPQADEEEPAQAEAEHDEVKEEEEVHEAAAAPVPFTIPTHNTPYTQVVVDEAHGVPASPASSDSSYVLMAKDRVVAVAEPVEKPAVDEPEPEPEPEPEYEYSTQLQLLSGMGFTNTAFNKFLLDEFKGDVQQAATRLLERLR